MTDGLEVFVHDVIAAMTTWPWSSVKVSPSSVTSTCVLARVATLEWSCTRAGSGRGSRAPSPLTGSPDDGGSLAGKDSDEPSSSALSRTAPCGGTPGLRASPAPPPACGVAEVSHAPRNPTPPPDSDPPARGRLRPAPGG